MSTTTVSDARRDFADLCNRVAYGRERVIIERHGKVRVALVPYEDLALIEEIEDKVDLLAADTALKEAEEAGTVSWEELKTELEL
jgi:prevent-host-death family protein